MTRRSGSIDSHSEREMQRQYGKEADITNEPMTPAPTFSEPLLDAGEAARLLRVPRSTLYELVRSRGLPHVRVGERGLRFVRADLATWVTENTYGTAVAVSRSSPTNGGSVRNASDTRLAASSRSTNAR